MAKKFQIDTPAQIGGLLEALSGIIVTGNASITGTLSVSSNTTISGTLTVTGGISGALVLGAQASATNHAVRADRAINTGSGLTGGGNLTSDRTISVNFTSSGGDNGTATTVARGDHKHDSLYLKLSGGTVTGNITFQNLDQGIVLGGGGKLIDQSTRTALLANLDIFEVLDEAGTTTIFQVAKAGTAPLFKGNTVWHSGNFDPNTKANATHTHPWSDITGTPTTLSGYGITDAVPSSRTISAGAGLTGGGDLTANRTLSVNFGGTGSATTVARSDHNHDSTYLKLTGGTLTGRLTIDGGANVLELKPGATNDHVYISFFADSQAQSTRSGYIGYGSAGTNTLTINNEMSNGNIDLKTNGTGIVTINGNTVWHAGNFNPASKADATHTHPWSSITGTPTTLAGYGITDAVPSSRTVTAGSGLTGGGALSSNITLSVNFGGNGSATTVARSDHNHDTVYLKLTGGTLTGELTFQDDGEGITFNSGARVYKRSSGTLTIRRPSGDADPEIENNAGTQRWKIWHAGNHGSGSGLDADTVDGIQASSFVQISRAITAGSGLTGGGNLSADVTLSVNFTTSGGDNGTATTVARGDHKHDSLYLKLTGGTLTGDITFQDDGEGINFYGGAKVYKRATGTLTIRRPSGDADPEVENNAGTSRWKIWHAGNDGSGSGLDADTVDGVHLSSLVQTSRKINVGTGLTGGGDLSADRTISLDTTYTDARYMRANADASTSGNLTVSGNATINGLLKVAKSAYSVSFAAGEVTKTITHNLGTTNYRVAVCADSPARHVYFTNKQANTVDIALDSAYTYGTINVDVILLPY